MSYPTDASTLERRKEVRLRLRPGLEISEQRNGERKCYVVKDPVTLHYFHLEDHQRRIIELMDGCHSLADIQVAYETNFRPARLTLEELEAFASSLLESGLVESDSPRAGKTLYQRVLRDQRHAQRLRFLNILCYRLPLWRPDGFLDKLVGVGRVFFHPWSLAPALGFLLIALVLVSTRRESLLSDMPVFSDFFSVRNMVFFWCLLGLVKVLHELGHGLCCKTMGGTVQGMGVLFLVFFPSLYCNVSDSWTLPSKWKRMAIGAAGIYVELWIASLAALAWSCTDSGTLIHHASLGLMLVCGVNTLVCNGNPLMRFDGYYILSDWLEAPNLALQATRLLRTAALRCLGAQVPWDEPQGRVSRAFLAAFGLASLVYRWVVLGITLGLVHTFFQAHGLGTLGVLIVGLGLGGMLSSLLYGLMRSLQRRGRFMEMKRARCYLASGLGLGAGLAFFLLPLPATVRGIALIQVDPANSQRVVVTEAGFLQELFVKDGQRVRAGEVLALLASPPLELKLSLNEAEQFLRQQQQKAFVALVTDLDLDSEREGDTWTQSIFEQNALTQGHRTLKKQLARLELRAPRDGVIRGLETKEHKGKWLEKGTELCSVGNDRTLRALVLVDPADQKLIHLDSPARILVHGAGTRHFTGSVAAVAQVDAKSIPAQLSNRVAGNVATQQDPVTKVEKPHSQHYLIAIRFHESDPCLHPGVLGNVKIETEWQTLWWRWRRFLGSTFSWGL